MLPGKSFHHPRNPMFCYRFFTLHFIEGFVRNVFTIKLLEHDFSCCHRTLFHSKGLFPFTLTHLEPKIKCLHFNCVIYLLKHQLTLVTTRIKNVKCISFSHYFSSSLGNSKDCFKHLSRYINIIDLISCIHVPLR